MLGPVAEAEDVVQEAYVRRASAGVVENERAFMTTVTTRLAIDVLRSARGGREAYVGPRPPRAPGGAAPPAAAGGGRRACRRRVRGVRVAGDARAARALVAGRARGLRPARAVR